MLLLLLLMLLNTAKTRKVDNESNIFNEKFTKKYVLIFKTSGMFTLMRQRSIFKAHGEAASIPAMLLYYGEVKWITV